jgi:hypothetical protein
VSASGRKLTPYLIYKGKKGARVTIEVTAQDFCPGSYCSVQEKAWMGQDDMVAWINQVWIPETRGERCLLLLDHYKVHLTALTRKLLEDAGTECYFVPPGCTCVVQPLDVGINKPMKDAVIQQYQSYIAERAEKKNNSTISLFQVRQLMAHFLVRSWNELSESTIQNSWRSNSNECPLFN